MVIKANIRVRYDHLSNCHNCSINRFNLKCMKTLTPEQTVRMLINERIKLQDLLAKTQLQLEQSQALLAKGRELINRQPHDHKESYLSWLKISNRIATQ